MYKRTVIRLSAGFSTEILQARREWHNIFKMMKGKKLQPRIPYPARLSFRFDEEIKSFPDKQMFIGSSFSVKQQDEKPGHPISPGDES